MPKIKIIDPTLAPSYRVPRTGIEQMGVDRAQPTRPVSSGKEILSQITGDLSKGVGDVAKYLGKKEELLRQTSSEEIQMNIAEEFVERLRHIKDQKGTQAKGLLDDGGYHYGAYEGLKEKYLTEDMDIRTTAEIQKVLDTQFLQERKMLIGHTLTQADIANKQIAKRRLDTAFSYINELTIRDPATYIHEIEKQAQELTTHHILREPELDRKQVGGMYKEELLYHGMIKSFMEEPVAATKLWEEKENYFEKNLPTKFDELAMKYKSAKDDANYDVVDEKLRLKHDNDYAAMAGDLEENYKDYDLHADDALELSAKYRGIANFNYTEEQRTRTEREEAALDHLDETWRDPDTGLINLRGYLNDLEQSYRRGEIDKPTRDFTRRWAMTGELSNEDFLEIEDEIDDGIITNKMQIRQRLAGRSTDKLPQLYSHLDKVQAAFKDGIDENQLNAAEQTFIRKAQADARDNSIPDFLKHQAVDANAFKEQMRIWAKQQGYSSQDPRIHAEVVRLLKDSLGWYYKHPTTERDMPFVIGRPGIGDYIGAIGTPELVRTTRWEYEAEHGRPEIQSEIQQEQNEETKKAIKMLQDAGKTVNTSTIEQTILYLKEEEEVSGTE